MTMGFRMFKHVIKDGFVGMWRNRMMSFASIGSVTSTLLILGIVLILILNMTNITNVAKEQFDEIDVFLVDDISTQQIERIGEEINEYEGVLSVVFRTKAQALEIMKQEWGDEGYLLEGFEENPLPSSYVIQLEDIKYANQVVEHLEGFTGIEDIKYNNDILEKMITIADFIRIAGIIIIAVLMFISVFIISNTVKITVAARQKEINIMKYVGATNGFVRGPFIIEGIFLGLVGALLSTLAVGYGYKYLMEMINEKLYVLFTVYMIPYQSLVYNIIIIFIAVGVGIGVLGSVLSLRKFLKV